MKQNSSNQKYSNEADGFKLAGGATERELSITGGDIEMTGSGSNTYTFPSTSGSIATLELIYPVGIVVTLGVSTNPSTLFGIGTWTRIEGRVVVGVSDSDTDFDLNDTGGAKTHTHGLSDGHALVWVSSSSARVFHKEKSSVAAWTSTTASPNGTPFSGGSISNGAELGGNTDSGSSLPPYIAKYVWQRTA